MQKVLNLIDVQKLPPLLRSEFAKGSAASSKAAPSAVAVVDGLPTDGPSPGKAKKAAAAGNGKRAASSGGGGASPAKPAKKKTKGGA